MAYIQGNKNYVHATTIDIAFPGNVTAGSLLVLTLHGYSSPSDITITDDRGNTWTEAGTWSNTGSLWIAMYYTITTNGGADTVHYSALSSTYLSATIEEYDGMAQTSVLDRTAVAAGVGTAVNTGNTAATTNASDLIVGATTDSNGTNTAITETGGLTMRQEYENGASYMHANVADRDVTSTGTYNATWTLATSSTWIARVAVFKYAPPPATTPSLIVYPISRSMIHILAR